MQLFLASDFCEEEEEFNEDCGGLEEFYDDNGKFQEGEYRGNERFIEINALNKKIQLNNHTANTKHDCDSRAATKQQASHHQRHCSFGSGSEYQVFVPTA